MTEKQEVKQAIRIVRKLFQAFFGRIYTKDITLLETGFDGVGIDYTFFRTSSTKNSSTRGTSLSFVRGEKKRQAMSLSG